MIAECMIFLASVLPMGADETKAIEKYMSCNDHVPKSMQQYAEHYVEHFDKENIPTAVRIGWCESRGKQSAYRNDNGDSGVMQFVSWTWNWVAEKYDLPIWDEWVVMRYGIPYNGRTSKSDIGFEFTRVQFTPHYNILFASILAEDIYGRTQWRDWNSSKWCWEDSKKWEKKWKTEEINLG
jgi:hypothetical protein